MADDFDRGTRLKDGRRFDAIRAQNRPTIRMKMPEVSSVEDSLTGILHKAIVETGNTESALIMQLDKDNMYGQDRFRHQLVAAMMEGNLSRIPLLSTLSMLNTVRLQMKNNQRYRDAITTANPELAYKLFADDSNLVLMFYSDLGNTPRMAQALRTLINSGQATIEGKLKVEQYVFLILKVADV